MVSSVQQAATEPPKCQMGVGEIENSLFQLLLVFLQGLQLGFAVRSSDIPSQYWPQFKDLVCTNSPDSWHQSGSLAYKSRALSSSTLCSPAYIRASLKYNTWFPGVSYSHGTSLYGLLVYHGDAYGNVCLLSGPGVLATMVQGRKHKQVFTSVITTVCYELHKLGGHGNMKNCFPKPHASGGVTLEVKHKRK